MIILWILHSFILNFYTNHGQRLKLAKYIGVSINNAIKHAEPRGYEIIITDYPAIVSTIIDRLAILITAGIFLSPIVIILIIKNKKKNKNIYTILGQNIIGP